MASKYWLLVKIDSFGKCRTQEVEEAKAFLCQQFQNSLTRRRATSGTPTPTHAVVPQR
jgi:hypothetical protein